MTATRVLVSWLITAGLVWWAAANNLHEYFGIGMAAQAAELPVPSEPRPGVLPPGEDGLVCVTDCVGPHAALNPDTHQTALLYVCAEGTVYVVTLLPGKAAGITP
jgi:hypothetical protein